MVIPNMSITRGAIWDVDGTLVDTAEHHFAAFARFCAEEGRGFTRDEFRWTFGRRNPEIMVYLFGDACVGARAEEYADRKERYYREAARENLALLPGAGALIDGLERAGWVQAIGSSAPRANLDLIMEVTGLAPRLAAVVSGDDTARGKPHPDVFLEAARRAGVEPRHCVVLEDAVAGVEAARAAGMRVIGVTYCAHSPGESLVAAGAQRVVANLAELSAGDLAALVDLPG